MALADFAIRPAPCAGRQLVSNGSGRRGIEGMHWWRSAREVPRQALPDRTLGGPIDSSGLTPRSSNRSRSTSLDGVLVGVVIALTIGMAVSVLVPGLQVRLVAPSLDLVLDTLTTGVTLSVAALGWARFRQRGEPIAPFQTAAFLVLAIVNGLAVTLVVTGLDRRAGMTLAAPSQAPLYAFTLARLFAAALLVVGGRASLKAKRPGHPAAVVLGSAVLMLIISAFIEGNPDRLPSLGSISVVAGSGEIGNGPWPLASPSPLGALVQVVGSALFLVAAALARRLHRRDGSLGDAYLAVGLVVAAFSQVATTIYPSTYTGLVTSGDVLRLVFDVILLLGIQAEARSVLSTLRQAHDDLTRLRVVELDHAALEERARLSRELHDGLAQDLWLAKLKTGRLAALTGLGLEGQALVGELGAAIDAGLVEAQQAVAALRFSAEATGTLAEVISRSVDEFSDRFGLRAEFECQVDLPLLPSRVQAEMLRIAQEALTNVRRHADATVVRVRATVADGRILLTVRDNGRGFDPDAASRSTFGLASMRERAALIGGELQIDTRLQGGTLISLFLPLAPLVPVAVTTTAGIS